MSLPGLDGTPAETCVRPPSREYRNFAPELEPGGLLECGDCGGLTTVEGQAQHDRWHALIAPVDNARETSAAAPTVAP